MHQCTCSSNTYHKFYKWDIHTSATFCSLIPRRHVVCAGIEKSELELRAEGFSGFARGAGCQACADSLQVPSLERSLRAQWQLLLASGPLRRYLALEIQNAMAKIPCPEAKTNLIFCRTPIRCYLSSH